MSKILPCKSGDILYFPDTNVSHEIVQIQQGTYYSYLEVKCIDTGDSKSLIMDRLYKLYCSDIYSWLNNGSMVINPSPIEIFT